MHISSQRGNNYCKNCYILQNDTALSKSGFDSSSSLPQGDSLIQEKMIDLERRTNEQHTKLLEILNVRSQQLLYSDHENEAS